MALEPPDSDVEFLLVTSLLCDIEWLQTVFEVQWKTLVVIGRVAVLTDQELIKGLGP